MPDGQPVAKLFVEVEYGNNQESLDNASSEAQEKIAAAAGSVGGGGEQAAPPPSERPRSGRGSGDVQLQAPKEIQKASSNDEYKITIDAKDVRSQIVEALRESFKITVDADVRGVSSAQGARDTQHSPVLATGAPASRGPVPQNINEILDEKQGHIRQAINNVYRNLNEASEAAHKGRFGSVPNPGQPGHEVEKAIELMGKFGDKFEDWIELTPNAAAGGIGMPTGGAASIKGLLSEYRSKPGETGYRALTSLQDNAMGLLSGGQSPRQANIAFARIRKYADTNPLEAQPAAAAAPVTAEASASGSAPDVAYGRPTGSTPTSDMLASARKAFKGILEKLPVEDVAMTSAPHLMQKYPVDRTARAFTAKPLSKAEVRALQDEQTSLDTQLSDLDEGQKAARADVNPEIPTGESKRAQRLRLNNGTAAPIRLSDEDRATRQEIAARQDAIKSQLAFNDEIQANIAAGGVPRAPHPDPDPEATERNRTSLRGRGAHTLIGGFRPRNIGGIDVDIEPLLKAARQGEYNDWITTEKDGTTKRFNPSTDEEKEKVRNARNNSRTYRINGERVNNVDPTEMFWKHVSDAYDDTIAATLREDKETAGLATASIKQGRASLPLVEPSGYHPGQGGGEPGEVISASAHGIESGYRAATELLDVLERIASLRLEIDQRKAKIDERDAKGLPIDRDVAILRNQEGRLDSQQAYSRKLAESAADIDSPKLAGLSLRAGSTAHMTPELRAMLRAAAKVRDADAFEKSGGEYEEIDYRDDNGKPAKKTVRKTGTGEYANTSTKRNAQGVGLNEEELLDRILKSPVYRGQEMKEHGFGDAQRDMLKRVFAKFSDPDFAGHFPVPDKPGEFTLGPETRDQALSRAYGEVRAPFVASLPEKGPIRRMGLTALGDVGAALFGGRDYFEREAQEQARVDPRGRTASFLYPETRPGERPRDPADVRIDSMETQRGRGRIGKKIASRPRRGSRTKGPMDPSGAIGMEDEYLRPATKLDTELQELTGKEANDRDPDIPTSRVALLIRARQKAQLAAQRKFQTVKLWTDKEGVVLHGSIPDIEHGGMLDEKGYNRSLAQHTRIEEGKVPAAVDYSKRKAEIRKIQARADELVAAAGRAHPDDASGQRDYIGRGITEDVGNVKAIGGAPTRPRGRRGANAAFESAARDEALDVLRDRSAEHARSIDTTDTKDPLNGPQTVEEYNKRGGKRAGGPAPKTEYSYTSDVFSELDKKASKSPGYAASMGLAETRLGNEGVAGEAREAGRRALGADPGIGTGAVPVLVMNWPAALLAGAAVAGAAGGGGGTPPTDVSAPAGDEQPEEPTGKPKKRSASEIAAERARLKAVQQYNKSLIPPVSHADEQSNYEPMLEREARKGDKRDAAYNKSVRQFNASIIPPEPKDVRQAGYEKQFAALDKPMEDEQRVWGKARGLSVRAYEKEQADTKKAAEQQERVWDAARVRSVKAYERQQQQQAGRTAAHGLIGTPSRARVEEGLGRLGVDINLTPEDSLDERYTSSPDPRVLKARAARLKASRSLPQRALSTSMVQIAQNWFGGTEGPQQRLIELGNRTSDVEDIGNRLSANRGKRREIATERSQIREGIRQAERQIDPATGMPRFALPRGVAGPAGTAFASNDPGIQASRARAKALGDEFLRLSRASRGLSKDLEVGAEKVAELSKSAVTGSDIMRNLGAGFIGGIAGGLVTGALSQVVGSITQVSGLALNSAMGNVNEISATRKGLGAATQAAGGRGEIAVAQSMAASGMSEAGMALVTEPLSVAAQVEASNNAINEQVNQLRLARDTEKRGAMAGASQSLGGPLGFGVGGTAPWTETTAKIIADAPQSRVQPGVDDAFTQAFISDGGWVNVAATGKDLGKAFEDVNTVLDKSKDNLIKFTYATGFSEDELTKQADALESLAPDYADLVRGRTAALVSKEAPGKLATPSEMKTSIEAVSREGSTPTPQALVDASKYAVQARIDAQTMQQRVSLNVTNPQTTAMANAMEGYGGTGGPSATSGTNFSDQSAGAQKKYNAELGATQKLYDQINMETDAGIKSAKEFVSSTLDQFDPGAGDAFASSLDRVIDLGKQIAGIKIGVETQNAALAADQFANSIYIAKRSLQDAKGLVGKAGGSNNLGAIERQQFMLQRESQGLGLGLSQRQINFSRAQASFQSPGDTSEERAARKEQAKIEADYAQKQLDIQKKLFGLGKRSFDISGARQVRDLTKQVALLERGRTVTLNTIAAEKKITALTKLQAKENKTVETYYNTAVQRTGDVIGQIQTIATQAQKAMSEVGNIVLKQFGITFKGMVDTMSGVTDTGYQRGGSSHAGGFLGTVTKNAGGFVGTVNGATSLGPVGVAGESAGEAVAILRDPKKLISPMGAMGGGGDTYNETVIINNPVVRNDQDITALTVQVEKALNRRAALIGMRSLR